MTIKDNLLRLVVLLAMAFCVIAFIVSFSLYLLGFEYKYLENVAIFSGVLNGLIVGFLFSTKA